MKTTYNRTMMIEDLTKAVVELHIYENCKYTTKRAELAKEEIMVSYTGVKSYSIIEGGKEAKAIESITDASGVDEYHEYLVLHFENGTTSTFRNSHVDMLVF
nr:MAG TPA: hypothetical protein [Caudoviricetes sp.]